MGVKLMIVIHYITLDIFIKQTHCDPLCVLFHDHWNEKGSTCTVWSFEYNTCDKSYVLNDMMINSLDMMFCLFGGKL